MLYKGFKRDFLMFLAALGDLVNELSYTTQYRKLLWPNYKPRYLSEQASRMVKVAEIEKVMVGGEPALKLTKRGWRLLDEVIPLRRLAQKRWDGIWRMVIFDIQEEKRYLRDYLREKLKSLGFGKWQRSVYITPHNVLGEMNEFLKEKGLYPRCVCLEAKRAGIGNDRQLASFVFKLSRLNIDYERIAADSWDLRGRIESGQAKREEASAEFKRVWEAYRDILLEDPFLPEELLPPGWQAKEAQEEFGELVQKMQTLF